jgi:hypothetical protein
MQACRKDTIILKIKGKTYRTPLAKTEDNPA